MIICDRSYSTILVVISILLSLSCDNKSVDTGNRPPDMPANPAPADGAGDQPIDIRLSWQCSDPDGDDLLYDLYFGTNSPPPLTDSNLTENSYMLGPLEYDTRYYWRVSAKDSHSAAVFGETWSFITRRAPGVYWKGQIDLSGERIYMCRIFVSDGYLYYVDSQNRGMQIIRVSDPSSPEHVGIYDPSTRINDVYISGAYAYLGCQGSSFRILDISNGADPRLISEISFSDYVTAVACRSDYAYVSVDGLQVVDISDRSAPTIVGHCDGFGVWYPIRFYQDYACMLHAGWETSYLDFVDISDPTSPFLVGSSYAGGSAWSLAVERDYVHVADWWFGGIRVKDISDPYNPVSIARYSEQSMSDIFIQGNLAYCASSGLGLRIYDISDIMDPQLIAGYDTENYVCAVFVAGGYVYLIEDNPRLLILEYVP